MLALIVKDKKLAFQLARRSFLWHLRYYLLGQVNPMSSCIYVTSKCNFPCEFCNIWRKRPGLTIPFDTAKKMVSDLGAMGCFYLNIAGGEPLAVSYVPELLEHARKSGILYTHVVTNGYLLDKKMAIRLGQTGIRDIAISIDGGPAYHDKKRATVGAYEKAVQAVKNIQQYAPHVKVVLNTIIFPDEPFESLAVVDLAKELDVKIKFQLLNQHPHFNPENDCTVSRGEPCQADILTLVNRLRSEPCVVNSRAFLDGMYQFLFDRENLPFKDADCLLGYHHLEIQEDGKIYPCLEGLAWRDGFPYAGNLREILHSSEYQGCASKLRGCQGCKQSYYICYYEPRLAYPLHNLLRSAVYARQHAKCLG